jgi:hypothetical protein
MKALRFSRFPTMLGLIAALSALPCLSQAADNGIYLGASFADVSPNDDWLASPNLSENDGFKLIGGIRPLDWLGIEANYVDLGSVDVALPVACPAVVGISCDNRASLEATALSVSAVAFKTFTVLDLFARAGVSRWQSEETRPFFWGRDDDGTDATYGVGLQLRLQSIAVRLEYERFKLLGDSTDAVSLGFTYTFL